MYTIPGNEQERLQTLRDLGVLGTLPEIRFDAICRTASALFGLPISYVSLIEKDHQWFKAKCGLDLDGTAREGSFCTYAILSDDVLVVEDARTDPRFAGSPLVIEPPHVRFYAGAPLILAPGIRVGTLCVLGTEPRSFSDVDRARLKDLAEIVNAQLRVHRIEAKLRESESHFRLLAESTSDMIVRSNLDTVHQYISPAVRTLLGFEAHELVGTKPIDHVHPEDFDALRWQMADLTSARIQQAVSRHRYRRKDGSWVWVETTINLTHDASTGRPDGYVAAVRDISERREADRKIAHMARHDPLTDLANRAAYRERIGQEIARCRRNGTGFALLCLDLDQFKAVNDTLGHQAGDTVLCIVASRLVAHVRVEDMVARIGGDEFVILQTGEGGPAGGYALARRLIDAIREPMEVNGREIRIGVSIGIAMAPSDGLDGETLYRNADLALYRAKAEGRNTVRSFSPEIPIGSVPRLVVHQGH